MEAGPSEVRHAIRGTMNALKLCVSAFEMPLEPSEKLEFLADVEASADKLAALLDAYEAFAPPGTEGTPPAPQGGPGAVSTLKAAH